MFSWPTEICPNILVDKPQLRSGSLRFEEPIPSTIKLPTNKANKPGVGNGLLKTCNCALYIFLIVLYKLSPRGGLELIKETSIENFSVELFCYCGKIFFRQPAIFMESNVQLSREPVEVGQ